MRRTRPRSVAVQTPKPSDWYNSQQRAWESDCGRKSRFARIRSTPESRAIVRPAGFGTNENCPLPRPAGSSVFQLRSGASTCRRFSISSAGCDAWRRPAAGSTPNLALRGPPMTACGCSTGREVFRPVVTTRDLAEHGLRSTAFEAATKYPLDIGVYSGPSKVGRLAQAADKSEASFTAIVRRVGTLPLHGPSLAHPQFAPAAPSLRPQPVRRRRPRRCTRKRLLPQDGPPRGSTLDLLQWCGPSADATTFSSIISEPISFAP